MTALPDGSAVTGIWDFRCPRSSKAHACTRLAGNGKVMLAEMPSTNEGGLPQLRPQLDLGG